MNLLAFTTLLPAPQTVFAQTEAPAPAAPDETPTALVGSGVTSYTLAAPKVCCSSRPQRSCGNLPGNNQAHRRPGQPSRTIYSQLQNCSAGQILSNLAADADFLYFINLTGLINGVLLIKDRKTFVRLYVKSDGASVPGVTATLSAPSLNLRADLNPYKAPLEFLFLDHARLSASRRGGG